MPLTCIIDSANFAIIRKRMAEGDKRKRIRKAADAPPPPDALPLALPAAMFTGPGMLALADMLPVMTAFVGRECTYRFVNNVDVVPKLPPVDFYKHVGQLKFIDRDGHLRLDMTDEADAIEPDLLKRLRGKGRALLENLFGLTIPAPFANHAPIYYATRIWNNVP